MYAPRFASHVSYPFPPEEMDYVSFTYTSMLHDADLLSLFFWSLHCGSPISGIRILR